jgi:hypothetical protein
MLPLTIVFEVENSADPPLDEVLLPPQPESKRINAAIKNPAIMVVKKPPMKEGCMVFLPLIFIVFAYVRSNNQKLKERMRSHLRNPIQSNLPGSAI